MALGELLARFGVQRVFGEPLAGAADPGVRDPEMAALLAEADGAVGAGIGAAFDGSVLTLTSGHGTSSLATAGPGTRGPGPDPEPRVVHSPSELVDALICAHDAGAGALALELGFDPRSDTGALPAPPYRDPSIAPRLPAPALPANGSHSFDLILAGSEVIRAGAVQALRDLAEATGLGVLNVFTAKGLFRWDSPFHLGTAGLQLHDFTLAGLGPDRSVLAIGVGRDECPDALLRDAGIAPDGIWPITGAAVDRVGVLAGSVRAAHDGSPVVGELFTRLWDVVQPLYRDERMPLNPARAAADIGEALPEGTVVTLEPGTAGWWIARVLPTTQLGSVKVPAAGRPGLAVAAAVLHALQGIGAVAIVEDPIGDESTALIELARARGLDLVVARWGDEGAVSSPEDHREQLRTALATPGVHVLDVPVDFGPATEELVEAAGPLAAWQ